jgi:tol-pal system protein YbgF
MVVRGFSTALLASLLLMAGGAGDSARLFAQNTPPQTQGQIGGQTNGDRLGTLEMRLMQLEQLVAAQNTLAKRQRMTDLTALVKRLEALEARLAGGAPIAGTAQENTAPANTANAANAANATNATNATNAETVSGSTAEIIFGAGQNAEAIRMVQAELGRLGEEVRNLAERYAMQSQADAMRFAQLEAGVRRSMAGISSTSAEPEIIGVVRTPVPIDRLDGDMLPAATGDMPDKRMAALSRDNLSASDMRLVGEGEISRTNDGQISLRAPLNDPKALYQRAYDDLRQGNYDMAEKDFSSLIEKFPKHDLAGNAQYWLGETYYVRAQYKRAAEAFLGGFTKYANGTKAPDSLLKLGMSLHALGEAEAGCDAFAELGIKFPDAPEAIVKRAEIERRRAGCAS